VRNFFYNLSLVILSIIISYLLAPHFGSVYDKFSPQRGSLFGGPKEVTNFVTGFPFALTFFTILLLKTVSARQVKNWIFIIGVLLIIFWAYVDGEHIYLPALIAAVAWFLGEGIRKLIARKKIAGTPPER